MSRATTQANRLAAVWHLVAFFAVGVSTIETATAGSTSLEASRTVRLVNPADPDDVKWFVEFSLPEEVDPSLLVSASVLIPTGRGAGIETSAIVEWVESTNPLPGTWDVAARTIDNWTREVPSGRKFALGSSVVYLDMETPETQEVEVSITPMLRAHVEAGGGPRFLVWYRLIQYPTIGGEAGVHGDESAVSPRMEIARAN